MELPASGGWGGCGQRTVGIVWWELSRAEPRAAAQQPFGAPAQGICLKPPPGAPAPPVTHLRPPEGCGVGEEVRGGCWNDLQDRRLWASGPSSVVDGWFASNL